MTSHPPEPRIVLRLPTILLTCCFSALLAYERLPTFGLRLDHDRDGRIMMHEGTGLDEPFRWWINDDDDEGEWQSGRDAPRVGAPDWSTPRIDGVRDLVDFFPAYLDCGELYRLNGHVGARFEVRCVGGGLEAYAAGLPPEDVGFLHRQPQQEIYGDWLDAPLEAAEPLGLAEGRWVHVPIGLLYRLSVEGVTGAAVLLLEGRRTGAFELELRVTTEHGEVHLDRRRIVISHVEEMYREIMAGGGLSRLGEPRGLPDAEVVRGWTVFVHGYNVPTQAARGWNAEMFKRLHAVGCRRKFVGVNWNGATGLDYHAAVQRAFFAGRALGMAASPLVGRQEVVVIAHSLGNVVAGEAIARGGLTPSRYYMVNAAVPAEAYAYGLQSPEQALHMTDVRWRGYVPRLHASNWHRLYPETDYRGSFRWIGAFGGLSGKLTLINAYSEGEDVTNCPEDVDSASVLSALLNGRDYSYGVWKTQELLKGVPMTRSLGTLFMRRSQAGWSFNGEWRGRYVPNGPREPGGHYMLMTPDEAALLTDDQLRARPFFGRFLWGWLHDSRLRRPTGSMQEFGMLTDVLARGVPAQSYAAGCHALALPLIKNFNLEAQGREASAGWPGDGHQDDKKRGRWLHSDFRNAALPYVHPFFQQLAQ